MGSLKGHVPIHQARGAYCRAEHSSWQGSSERRHGRGRAEESVKLCLFLRRQLAVVGQFAAGFLREGESVQKQRKDCTGEENLHASLTGIAWFCHRFAEGATAKQ